jgi:zinc transport system substrate-binding protein
MHIVKKGIAALGLVLALSGAYAGEKSNNYTSKSRITVAVSILPQRYFLERIGGERVTALTLVGPGQSPHSYEPTPSQMAALSGAKAWILSGTDFEEGLRPAVASQFPKLKIVDGTEGISFRKLQDYEMETDDHGHEEAGGHRDSNVDRHTWLGYASSKIMATRIRDALALVDPAGKSVYDANCSSLLKDIDDAFSELKVSLAPLSGKTVMVFHPSFGYFLDEFGIKQAPVETGGKEPTAKALASLIAKAKSDKVPAIFVQTQFPVNAAKTIGAQAGAQVVMLDPLAPDWLANIRRIGEALKKAYK